MDTTFREVSYKCPVCGNVKTEQFSSVGEGPLSDTYKKLCFKADKQYPQRNISDCGLIADKLKNPVRYKEITMGIPPRFLDASVFDLNRSKIKGRIDSIINGHHSEMVLFMGKAGLGKTHLSAILLNEICVTSALSGRFINFLDLMEKIKSAIAESKTEEILELYTNVDILCIDELGGEKSTEYSNSVLYRILNNRYNSMKMTIVTTNETNDSITQKYEERTLSRLISGHVFGLSGDDRRKMDCKYTNAEV